LAASERYLAIDLGATSGRAFLGVFDGERIVTEEVARFENVPLELATGLFWDVPRIERDVIGAIERAVSAGPVRSVSVDGWGLDFGLIGADGDLLEMPRHYRDRWTDGAMEAVLERIPAVELYGLTGIQMMRINTICQLWAMHRHAPALLDLARALLLIPDLLTYRLTGAVGCELTNASTTQLLDVRGNDWVAGLLERLGLPGGILPTVILPGTARGAVDGVASDAVLVIAGASHDTASAVLGAAGLRPDDAFISSGTWSLVGAELSAPVTTEAARVANFSNERGVENTTRLLRNVMGLWLEAECRRAWAAAGQHVPLAVLLAGATAASRFRLLFDPDDPSLLPPGDMPARIVRLSSGPDARAPEQAVLMRAILECLALKYRYVLERLEEVLGRRLARVCVVGGGARNALLCQLTADATGRPVVAGPAEASALGNLAMQLIAAGRLGSVAEARAMLLRSQPPVVYEPGPSAAWDEAYRRILPRFNATARR